MEKLIKEIENLGYIVSVEHGIDIFEPFTSKVTGENYNHKIAFSSSNKDNKWTTDFLERTLKSLK